MIEWPEPEKSSAGGREIASSNLWGSYRTMEKPPSKPRRSPPERKRGSYLGVEKMVLAEGGNKKPFLKSLRKGFPNENNASEQAASPGPCFARDGGGRAV